MKASLPVGKVLGIDVKIHWTFPLLLIYIAYTEWAAGGSTAEILWTLALVLLVFVCVVMHEYGHSLTARRFGVATRSITLLPIGGVASLEKMPEQPRQELLVAIAGPLVNVVIATVLLVLLGKQVLIWEDTFPEMGQGQWLLAQLFWINIMLVLFNALPAFPMDGGRVLRALLAMRMTRLRATRIASIVGRIMAVGFVVAGFYLNPFLIAIGLFVWLGASGEYQIEKKKRQISHLQIGDMFLMTTDLLPVSATLQELKNLMLEGFLKVVFLADDQGNPVRYITRDELVAVLSDRPDSQLDQVPAHPVNVILQADDKLVDVVEKVLVEKQAFIPVMAANQLKGFVTHDSIFRAWSMPEP